MNKHYKNRNRRLFIILLISIITLIAISLISSIFGSVKIDILSLFNYENSQNENAKEIFFKLRLPRILLAILSGSILSITGCVFQSLLRNPLAEPYTLGIAGGASFGATLAILLPIPSYLTMIFDINLENTYSNIIIELFYSSWISIASFVFAMLTLVFIFFVLGRKTRLSGTSLILAGITINFFFSGFVMLIYYFASPYDTSKMIRWIMGSVDTDGYIKILLISGITIPISIYFIIKSKVLNIVNFGEDFAKSKGINVKKIYWKFIILSSFIVSLIVSITGPISFVGLIIPHIIRQITGFDHRMLLPLSLVWGACFLVLCDLISRNILSFVNYDSDIPIGVITALLGAMFFLWILKTYKRDF